MRCIVLLLLAATLVNFCLAQTQTVIPTLDPSLPRIRFGRSTTFTPGSTQTAFGIRLDDAFRYWQNQTNLAGGININGTSYFVEQVVYNDGADCNTMLILYERLITVDKVDFLLAPTGFDCQRLALLAEKYGVPYLNGADSSYQRVAETNPLYAGLQWTFTFVPDYHSTPNCFRALADLGDIKSFIMAANPEVPDYPGYVMGEVMNRNGTIMITKSTYDYLVATPSALDYNVVALINGYQDSYPNKVIITTDVIGAAATLDFEVQGITMLDYDRFSLTGIQASFSADNTLNQNCTYFDTFIDKWVALKPEAWVGTASDFTDSMLICMHRRSYHPANIWHWVAINYPPSHAWQYVGSLIQNAWEPTANFSDASYGNTQKFNADILAQYGIVASSYEAQQAITGELAVRAIQATQSIDPVAVRNWLRTFNVSTIINRDTFFLPGTQQTAQQRLCFQTLSANGTQVVVYPPQYANVKPIVVNPVFTYPQAFLDSLKSPKGLSKRDLTLAISFPVVFGGIAILGAVGYLVFRRYYHTVIIQKTPGSDEWA